MPSLRQLQEIYFSDITFTGNFGDFSLDLTTMKIRRKLGPTEGGLSDIELDVTSIKSSNYQINSNEIVRINSFNNSFTLTLPSTPTLGDTVVILDIANTCGKNPVSISGNGKSISSDISGLTIDLNGAVISLVFDGISNWNLINSFNGNFLFPINNSLPNEFRFKEQQNVNLNSSILSETITVTGLTPNKTIQVTCSGGKIDAGRIDLSGNYEENKTIKTSNSGTIVISARQMSANVYDTMSFMTITVGTFTTSWKIITKQEIKVFGEQLFTSGSYIWTTPVGINTVSVGAISGESYSNFGKELFVNAATTATLTGSGTIVINPGITRLTLTGRGANGGGQYTPAQGNPSYPLGLPEYNAGQSYTEATSTTATFSSHFFNNFTDAANYPITISNSGFIQSYPYGWPETFEITIDSPSSNDYNDLFNFPVQMTMKLKKNINNTPLNQFTPQYEGEVKSKYWTINANPYYVGTSAYNTDPRAQISLIANIFYTLHLGQPSTPYIAPVGNISFPNGLPPYAAPIDTRFVGAATIVNIDDLTYTFPGGIHTNSTSQSYTVSLTGNTTYVLEYNVPIGGDLQYSFNNSTFQEDGKVEGTSYSISPALINNGPYIGKIAAWKNKIPVSTNQMFSGIVGNGGAVRIVWGDDKLFPNNLYTNPTSFSLVDISNVPLNSEITSTVVVVRDLIPNAEVLVVGAGGVIDAGTINLSGTFEKIKRVITSDAGTILLVAKIISSNSVFQKTSMTITVDTFSDTWSVTTGDIVKITGEQTFTSGEFTWTVPSNITSVSVAAISGNTFSKFSDQLYVNNSTTHTLYGSGVVELNKGLTSIKLIGKGLPGETINIPGQGNALYPSGFPRYVPEHIQEGIISSLLSMGTGIYSGWTSDLITINGHIPTIEEFLFQQNITVIGNESRTINLNQGNIILYDNTTYSGSYLLIIYTIPNIGTMQYIIPLIPDGWNGPTTYLDGYEIGTGNTFPYLTLISPPITIAEIGNIAFPDGLLPYIPEQNIIYKGDSTVVTLNGQTYTFEGGNGVAAIEQEIDITLPINITQYITYKIPNGGKLKYIHEYAAFNYDGFITGTNFSITPDITSSGPYTGAIAAWKNNIPVTPNSKIKGFVGENGAIRVVWGVDRIFPDASNAHPQTFNFINQTSVATNSIVTSNCITIVGLLPNTDVTVTGTNGYIDAGTVALSGTFSVSKTVTTNNKGTIVVAAQMNTSNNYNQQTSMTILVGSTSSTWTVTTMSELIDTTPTIFNFDNLTDVALEFPITSNTVSVSGLTPNTPITIIGAGCEIDAGATTLSGIFSSSKTIISSDIGTIIVVAKLISSNLYNTRVGATITIGTVSKTWYVTTTSVTEDKTPDPFNFVNKTNEFLNSTITSDPVIITGLTPNTSISVIGTGGLVDAGTISLSGIYSTNKTIITSSTGSIVVTARMTSGNTYKQQTSMTIKVGNVSDTWSVTTADRDTTPSAFSFEDKVNVPLNMEITTGYKILSGFSPNISITLTCVDGVIDAGTDNLSGTFDTQKIVTTSETGNIVIEAKMFSSSSYSQTKTMTISIENNNYYWSTKTLDLNLVPNAFNFIHKIGVDINSEIISNTVTVTGMTPNETVIVTGVGGTVDAGTTTLSGTFAASKSVTTSNTGSIVIAAKMTSSNTPSQQRSMNISINNSIADNWYVTTSGNDPIFTFEFVDEYDVSLNSVITSKPITVTGLVPNTIISISCINGTIDAGTVNFSNDFTTSKSVTTSSTGTIVVKARTTSSNISKYLTMVTVTIGNISDTWKVMTREVDLFPNFFSFVDKEKVLPNTPTISNSVLVTGLSPNTTMNISATNGLVDAGTTTLSSVFETSKTITTSSTGSCIVAAMQTSSINYNQRTSMSVTVGTFTTTWYVTTDVLDSLPNPFNIPNKTNAIISSIVTSETVTVTGLTPNTTITVSAVGGEIDAGTTTLSGTFEENKSIMTSNDGTLVVAARILAGTTYNQTTSMEITVGEMTDIWYVTTVELDITPNTFTFIDQTGKELNEEIISNKITVTGLTPNSSINVSGIGGEVDAGTTDLSGSFSSIKTINTSTSGNVVVAAKMPPLTSYNRTNTMYVTVGNGSTTWKVSSKSLDELPEPFHFTNISDVEVNTDITSEQIMVSGMTPNVSIMVSATNGVIDAGTTTLSNTFAQSKNINTSITGNVVVAAKMTSSSSYNQQKTMDINVGSGHTTWTVTTKNNQYIPDSFDIPNEVDVAINSNIVSKTTTVTGFGSNISINVIATGGWVDAGTTTLSSVFESSKTINTGMDGNVIVAAKMLSSNAFSQTTSMNIKVGDMNDTWYVTTKAIDITPNLFKFDDRFNVNPGQTVTSEIITISGLTENTPVVVSAVGGNIDAGTYQLSTSFEQSKTVTTSSNGTLVIKAAIVASSTFNTSRSMTINVGTGSTVWTVITKNN